MKQKILFAAMCAVSFTAAQAAGVAPQYQTWANATSAATASGNVPRFGYLPVKQIQGGPPPTTINPVVPTPPPVVPPVSTKPAPPATPPAPTPPYLGLPNPAHSATLNATYVGTANASFGFTTLTILNTAYPRGVVYNGIANEVGVANITATATAAGASFSGTLSGFKAGSQSNLPPDYPANFNQLALALVPSSVSISGAITQTGVTGSMLVPGSGPATSIASTAALTRTKDFLPNALAGYSMTNGNGTLYRCGAGPAGCYMGSTTYTYSATRK